MHRPSGWRPTAFYFANGVTTAYTGPAVLDNDGAPVGTITDPADNHGLILNGPWLLTEYKERWGHAFYHRPDGWGDGAVDGVFKAPGTVERTG